MPDADLGGVTIHYEVAGDGPLTYVYCHGLGSSGAVFAEEDMAWYAARFRTVAWDQRGLGRSGHADRYSLPLYAADLAALLDRLEAERAVVFGVSWGGYLVQRFALDYPERCAAIVIDSSSSEVNLASSEDWYQRGEAARLGAAAIAGRRFEPAFEGHRALDASNAPQVEPRYVDSYVAQARAIAGTREHPLTGELHRIACPALVVGGGADEVAGAGGSVLLGRRIPGARTEIVQDAGHGVYRDRRETFRALLLDFLAGCGLHRE